MTSATSKQVLNDSVHETRKAQILKALVQTHGDRSRAAEALGISRAALYRWLRRYDLMEQPGSVASSLR